MKSVSKHKTKSTDRTDKKREVFDSKNKDEIIIMCKRGKSLENRNQRRVNIFASYKSSEN
jgi:hypothetical protein